MKPDRLPEAMPAEAEARRLAALDRYEILDTPREEAFDRVTRLVRRIFEVETALISFLDAHRQWHKSALGFTAGEVPRRDTLCQNVLATGEMLVLNDASKDAGFCDNPFVKPSDGVRFYAGAPIKSPEGYVLGTVCAIDSSPRTWSPADEAILTDLAAVVMDQIALRQLVATDVLTGVLARRTFEEEAGRAIARALRHGEPLACITFDLDRFKSINDRFGHAAGDEVLKAAAAACGASLRNSDIIGRVGGEEFVIIAPNTQLGGAMDLAERLRMAISARPVNTGKNQLTVTASCGGSLLSQTEGSLAALLSAADHAMYVSKSEGRDRVTAAKGRSNRRRVLKPGLIVTDEAAAINCTVRSLGSHGAGIDVSNSADVPDRFRLKIGPEREEKACRVAARNLRHLEVQFL